MSLNSTSPSVAGIHVLADDDPSWKLGPVDQAIAACDGGASVVQLRTKYATDIQILEWARAIRAITRHAGVIFILNDRFDLALAAKADGVHLGQTDLPLARVPSDARGKLCFGVSTHDLNQVSTAAKKADYVAFGPIFGTRSKVSPHAAPGLQALKEAVQLAHPVPLVAIGGIGTANISAIQNTGAAGAAVISAVAQAPDPASAARKLSELFPKKSVDVQEKK
jgi:thiamine-phosphate pyrophosphorylase